jgi:uncharacterized iron-regulated membrane protein
MKRALTRTLRTLHVWTGLALGALFCLMSLTGSVIVFRPMIEEMSRPAWTAKSDARPARVLTEAAVNVSRQWPQARIGSISFPTQSGAPIEFGLRTSDGGELRAFVDARSGEVLGTFTLPWLDWLTDLHHHVQIESVGKKIVGFIGIFLVLSSLTGLLTWAFRAARWTRLLGTHRGSTWQFTKYDLHRSIGVMGNALLLFVAGTGVIIAFPQTITVLLGGPVVAAAPYVFHPGEGRMTLEEYVSAAQRALPGGAVRQLRIPPGADRPVTTRMWVPGDLRQRGSARVSLEPGTAQVLAVDEPADWPLSKTIVQAASPLHYGEWGGMAIRVLWALIGVIPAVLFVSGVMMWWAPFEARRRAARIAADRTLVRA